MGLCVLPCPTHNTELSEPIMDETAPRLGQSFGSQRLKPTNLGKPVSIHSQEEPATGEDIENAGLRIGNEALFRNARRACHVTPAFSMRFHTDNHSTLLFLVHSPQGLLHIQELLFSSQTRFDFPLSFPSPLRLCLPT